MNGSGTQPYKRFFNILLAAAWAAVFLLCVFHFRDFTLENILSYTPESLLLASLLMLGLFALKSISIFFYSGILYAANGLLFSLPYALLMDCLGIAVMLTGPYLLGRRLGKPAIGAIAEKYPRVRQVIDFRPRSDLLYALLLRFFRILSGDVVSLYQGAIALRYPVCLLASLLAYLPEAVLFSVMGTSIRDPGSPAFIAAAVTEIILFAGTAAATVIYYRRRK